MIRNNSTHTAQPETLLKNVRGTFAAEGIVLSETCLDNLTRIAYGKASGQQVLSEIKAKYEKRRLCES